jgi:hypothetical protein
MQSKPEQASTAAINKSGFKSNGRRLVAMRVTSQTQRVQGSLAQTVQVPKG